MSQLLELILFRPLSAFLSSAELLDQKLGAAQMIDGMLSRMVHTLSRPYVNRPDHDPVPPDQSQSRVAPDDSRSTRADEQGGCGRRRCE
jgi:hypothetical protein